MEDNRKTVNSIYLNKLLYERDTTHGVGNLYKFTDGEKNELLNVAYQNPLLGGNSVYQARVLLWIEVPDTATVSQNRAPIHRTEKPKQSNFKLYPNPNNGSMTLEYALEGSNNAIFSIYSMDGKLVKQQALNSDNKTASIDAGTLNAGVYYYTVKEGDKNTKADKLIIVK